jgi:hypothetical protein
VYSKQQITEVEVVGVLLLCCRELAQIGISSGLISEAEGNAIKELLRKGPVSVALNWTDVLPKAKQVGSGRHSWYSVWEQQCQTYTQQPFTISNVLRSRQVPKLQQPMLVADETAKQRMESAWR